MRRVCEEVGVDKPSVVSRQSCRPPPWVVLPSQALPLLHTSATINNGTIVLQAINLAPSHVVNFVY